MRLSPGKPLQRVDFGNFADEISMCLLGESRQFVWAADIDYSERGLVDPTARETAESLPAHDGSEEYVRGGFLHESDSDSEVLRGADSRSLRAVLDSWELHSLDCNDLPVLLMPEVILFLIVRTPPQA